MLRNMATSLLRHETIRTTVPKAKELRRVVEPLITLAKVDSLGKRRLAYSRLRDESVVEKLFVDLGPRFKARAGGYTRILKMEPRPGDSADMALMQLVESAAVCRPKRTKTRRPPRRPRPRPKKKKPKKTRRRGEREAAAKPKRREEGRGLICGAPRRPRPGGQRLRRTRLGSCFPASPPSSRHCLRSERRRRA